MTNPANTSSAVWYLIPVHQIYSNTTRTLTTDCHHQSQFCNSSLQDISSFRVLCISLLSLNLHNLSGPREAAEAGWDCINAQVKGRWWLIHEAVCKEPSSRVISRLSAPAHAAMGVGQCCVSGWGFHKQDLSLLFRHLSHKEGRRVADRRLVIA